MILHTPLSILAFLAVLALPLWFAYLDRRVFPRLRWVDREGRTPPWGHAIVVLGLLLVLLLALRAPAPGSGEDGQDSASSLYLSGP